MKQAWKEGKEKERKERKGKEERKGKRKGRKERKKEAIEPPEKVTILPGLTVCIHVAYFTLSMWAPAVVYKVLLC